jgi:hypothetical protein
MKGTHTGFLFQSGHGRKRNITLLNPFRLFLSQDRDLRGTGPILLLPFALNKWERESDGNQERNAQHLYPSVESL